METLLNWYSALQTLPRERLHAIIVAATYILLSIIVWKIVFAIRDWMGAHGGSESR